MSQARMRTANGQVPRHHEVVHLIQPRVETRRTIHAYALNASMARVIDDIIAAPRPA